MTINIIEMNIFVPFIIAFFIAIIDGSMGSFIVLTPCLIVSYAIIKTTNSYDKKYSYWNIVSVVYIIFAFIASFSFEDQQYHVVFDPTHYIADYQKATHFPTNVFNDIIYNYSNLIDNNCLYNYLLWTITVIAYKFGGATIYSMTCLQTGFGILASSMLYRIISIYTSNAFRYALLFSIFGFLMFYSGVIIRDVIISFFYFWAIYILLQKSSLKGLLCLCLIFIITIGLRLYSGFFVALLLCYYLYKFVYDCGFRKFANIMVVLIVLMSFSYIITSAAVESTMEEMKGYNELSANNSSGGFITKLQKLPPGISHLSIMLFSMVKPLPPFYLFKGTNSFSNFMLSSVLSVSLLWWYFIYFITLFGLLAKEIYRKLTYNELCLTLLAILFLLANTSHPDVRRMLPMFPILYIIYIKIRESDENIKWVRSLRIQLWIFYIVIALIVSII